jgi:hypothetical protein
VSARTYERVNVRGGFFLRARWRKEQQENEYPLEHGQRLEKCRCKSQVATKEAEKIKAGIITPKAGCPIGPVVKNIIVLIIASSDASLLGVALMFSVRHPRQYQPQKRRKVGNRHSYHHRQAFIHRSSPSGRNVPGLLYIPSVLIRIRPISP